VYRPADAEAELKIGTITVAGYLATGASTNGQFGLYRWDMSGQPVGATPHFHKTISESFFILSGAVKLFNGESWIDASSGDFLRVPEGGIHGFRNESGAPREEYFETLAEITAGRQMGPEEWTKLYRRHDQYMV